MSMLDKLKNMLKGHEDTARKGMNKAGDAVDRKTGGKHRDKIDTAQQKFDDQLGKRRDDPGR
ncbi:antitoxin [Streptomyces sp. 71268]|uniref:antitoxin n=1 Tax=Streptomyces sp. 71268 TaxID=3002640 RepID=UPI0023F61831|nr:antitoxin [Streptomyces sp. 71268]WEV27471.1 antitoxin [Streptomyces sp. 71268]